MSTDEKKEEDTFTFMKTDESFAVFMKGFNLQHRRKKEEKKIACAVEKEGWSLLSYVLAIEKAFIY